MQELSACLYLSAYPIPGQTKLVLFVKNKAGGHNDGGKGATACLPPQFACSCYEIRMHVRLENSRGSPLVSTHTEAVIFHFSGNSYLG